MIHINLIRQLQPPPTKSSWLGSGGGAILFLLVGLVSGWWTQTLQIEHEALLQEKIVTAQSLSRLRKTIDRLSQVKTQGDGMMASLQQWQKEISTTRNPTNVVNMIGQSVQNLQVWLDAIQIDGAAIEIHGQAYLMGDVGKCLDRLESSLPLRELPFVEIQDGTHESAASYSFIIRLSIQESSVT
ncbi:MAG: PilN domain-containing protein [Nitrospirales bacterium]|nr:PilN domain-containing protein [Nitrospirales bacterium]